MTDLYRLLPEEMEKLVIDMGYQRYRADQILMPLYYKFPKNIADIKSQFLVLGALEEDGKVVLLHPSQPTKNGLKIA